MNRFAGILCLGFLTFAVCSCDAASYHASNERKYMLSNSSLPIDDQYESFFCRDELVFEEEKEGIDIYKVEGDMTLDEGIDTMFYFKDGRNVGFRTADPKYGFNILGDNLYSRVFDNTPTTSAEQSLYTQLWKRNWEPSRKEKVLTLSEHLGAAKTINGIERGYGWTSLSYEKKSNFIINLEYEISEEGFFSDTVLMAMEVIFVK